LSDWTTANPANPTAATTPPNTVASRS
jgi:hypothetical protein